MMLVCLLEDLKCLLLFVLFVLFSVRLSWLCSDCTVVLIFRELCYWIVKVKSVKCSELFLYESKYILNYYLAGCCF